MTNVILTLRIFPSDVNIDLNILKKKILEKVGNIVIREEPIGFGLTALIINVLVEDKEGETEKIENLLRNIEGVGELEIIEVSRTL
ncbi:MAG: elongation factor 1-beta [Candidatus Aenigmatarchaeota archaeon]